MCRVDGDTEHLGGKKNNWGCGTADNPEHLWRFNIWGEERLGNYRTVGAEQLRGHKTAGEVQNTYGGAEQWGDTEELGSTKQLGLQNSWGCRTAGEIQNSWGNAESLGHIEQLGRYRAAGEIQNSWGGAEQLGVQKSRGCRKAGVQHTLVCRAAAGLQNAWQGDGTAEGCRTAMGVQHYWGGAELWGCHHTDRGWDTVLLGGRTAGVGNTSGDGSST